jgi:hypothetical protein
VKFVHDRFEMFHFEKAMPPHADRMQVARKR